MTPRFILPAGYTARDMQFVLSRERNGWRFYGHADGYAVPAHSRLCVDRLFQREIIQATQEK